MSGPRAFLLLLVAAVLYGGSFPVNRLASEAGWPALAFALIPALFAGIALAVLCTVRGVPLPLGRKAITANLVIGGLGIGLPVGILVAAAEHLPASTLTLVLCLSPILTLTLAAATGSERFERRVFLGMILGTLGIVLIVWPDSGVVEEGGAGWFLLALLAPAMFAVTNNCAVWLRPPATPAVAMAAGTLLGGALVATLVALATGARFWPAETGPAQIFPLLLSVGINGVVFWLFFLLVAAIGAARFSLFNYLAIAAGILWSMAVFGERPTPVFWVAAALMLLGMHLALRAKGGGRSGGTATGSAGG
jgi:drug/metabolite transporter (DMT)-like permease